MEGKPLVALWKQTVQMHHKKVSDQDCADINVY